jgi:hypothetical protein
MSVRHQPLEAAHDDVQHHLGVAAAAVDGLATLLANVPPAPTEERTHE